MSNSFDDIYLVSLDIQPVTHAEVEALQSALGLPLPVGYVEFITRFGEGLYCDFFRILSPKETLERALEVRRWWQERWFFESPESLLTQEQAVSGFMIASSIDGDQIVFYPPQPEKLYILPRHSRDIQIIRADFSDLHTWGTDDGSTHLRTFEPFNNRAHLELLSERTDFQLTDLRSRVDAQWGISLEPDLSAEEEDDSTEMMLLYVQAIGGRIQFIRYDHDGRVRLHIEHNHKASGAVDAFIHALSDGAFNHALAAARANQSLS